MIGYNLKYEMKYVRYRKVVIVTCGVVLLIGVLTDLWHCVTL